MGIKNLEDIRTVLFGFGLFVISFAVLFTLVIHFGWLT